MSKQGDSLCGYWIWSKGKLMVDVRRCETDVCGFGSCRMCLPSIVEVHVTIDTKSVILKLLTIE